MQIIQITFSPTSGTQKVADILTDALAAEIQCAIEKIDLADPFIDEDGITVPSDALAVIAMPCFGGRAPEIAMKRLSFVKGSGAKCIIVNVYGNRAFDDALLEMKDGADAAGFKVIAAIAAIAEHSIMHQFATGRPDETDVRNLKEFAHRIAVKSNEDESASSPLVPGNKPYMKAGSVPLVPKITGKCVSCGECAKECPVTAINTVDFSADKAVCISCMRCINVCPQNARSISKIMVKVASLAIKKMARIRKECELFI